MAIENECIFCRIASREIPAEIVFEDDRILAFRDLKPQAPVHILLVPKRHIAKVSELTQADMRMMGDLVLTAKEIAAKMGIAESGYRIVLNCNKDAGQEVFHLHLHLMGGRKFSWPPG